MPGLGVAWESWRRRSTLARIVLIGGALLLAMPFGLAFVATQALGASVGSTNASAGAATPPMGHWTVTQEFGCTGLWFEPPYGDCAHFHSGIDLAADYGTPVVAVLPGLAHVLRSEGGFGLHVVIEHPGGMVTLYGHLALVTVADGAVVAAGQQVGLEGSSGNSTGPHLHFEVRQGGVPAPPRQVFPDFFGPRPATNGSGSALLPMDTKGRQA